MPAIPMRVIAVAGMSALALAGCTGGPTASGTTASPAQPRGRVEVPSPAATAGGLQALTDPGGTDNGPAFDRTDPSGPARAAASTGAGLPAPLSPGTGGQYAGLSSTDWNSIEQALAQADSALAQSDADATHTEQGDTTP